MKLKTFLVFLVIGLFVSSQAFAYDNQNKNIGKNMRENARESGQNLQHLDLAETLNPMNWFQQEEPETAEEGY